MRLYSVPADFSIETLDKLKALNDRYMGQKVIETYGQVTMGALVNSGRVTDVLPQVDMKGLAQYVAHSKRNGMEFSYTLNPACFGNLEFSRQGMEQISDLLSQLHDIGIESLTVTSPSLIEMVKSSLLPFTIKGSAICEINSPGKAKFYKDLGLERIVVDPDITRNFRILQNICQEFGPGVEIIINNICYKNCAYKMFHYNHEAHCTSDNKEQTIKDYYFNRCSMQKSEHVRNLIKLNWIRPEDMALYERVGITHYKIQGRQNVLTGDLIQTLESYFNEHFEGNLFDLITLFAPYNSFQPFIDNKKLDGFLKPMAEGKLICTDMCESCNYCLAFARKSMNTEMAEELNRKSLAFYREYDQYTKAIQKPRQTSVLSTLLFEDETI